MTSNPPLPDPPPGPLPPGHPSAGFPPGQPPSGFPPGQPPRFPPGPPPPGWQPMGPPPPPRPSGPRTWVPGLLTGAGVTLLPSLVAVGFGPEALLAVAAASTLLLAPAALLVGTVLACIDTTRNFGIGLLIAAGVGVIVLGGTCVGAVNWSSMRTAP